MDIFKKSKVISIQISSRILDIFFPKRCVCCHKFGYFLCLDCAKNIELIKTDICPECGKISEKAKYCPNCKKKLKTRLKGVLIAANYDSQPVKEMIHNLKYNGLIEISELLGELLYQKLMPLDLPDCLIVPVPLHRKRQNFRGFNQSELIARYIAKKLGLNFADCIRRVRDTKPQVALKREERRKNVVGSFYCNGDSIIGKNIILVDDVTTTGATLSECAKALKEAGAKRIYGAVVARNV